MDLVDDESRWRRYLHRHGYHLCHHIGYGSFGDVFSVTKSSPDGDNTNFAVKRLVTQKNILEDEYAMMEIQSLLHLQHQNIIPVLEVFLSQKVACIVMELAPLGNLEMFVKNSDNDISTCFVTNAFGQILSAVDYCHSFYLAHRDINPSNLLMFNGVLVKLADFGLCFQCRNEDNGRLIRCSDYLGHDNYLAPEVKLCKPYQAMPADVWSLGCVLRYLATKRHTCDDHTLYNKGVFKSRTHRTIHTNENTGNIIAHNNNLETTFHSQETNYDEKKTDVMISCFVDYLCHHSPQERPTVNDALLCWKRDFNTMNKNKVQLLDRAEKEE